MKPGVGHTIFRRIPGRPTILAMAIAAAMAASLQAPAWGAGLGRLTVQSALGQPLVAEVEITSLSREELGSLSARLAPAEAFLQAGLDFRPALSTLRFAIDRRSDDRAFVRITSTQPVNEPFVDLLVELNWAAGRFVREYTFLLDPPELRIGRNTVEGGTAGSRVATPAARSGIVPLSAPGAVRAAASGDAGANGVTAPSPAAEQSAARSVTVQRGEVLASIAARTAPEGVAVEQAILAIYNANPQAFFGNVHQMYAGRTLAIPDRAAMQSVAVAEARRQIQQQTAAFNARRERLAAALPTVDTATAEPSSGGSTTASPQEAPAAAPAALAGDQLRLSSAAPAPAVPGAAAGAGLVASDASQSSESAEAELADAGGTPGAGSSSAAPGAAGTRIAGAAALRDQAARVTALEKSVADLQGLLQLKSHQLAELQQQVEARGLSPRAGAAPVASPGSAATDAIGSTGAIGVTGATGATQGDGAATIAPSATAGAASARAAGAERGAGAASLPPPEGGATQAAAPSAPAASGARGSTTARPTSAPSALAPDRERSFVDELLDSPMTMPGLAAILVALGAYGWYTLRRRKSESFEDSLIAADAFTANSLFGTTGGQAVDTSDEAMFGPSTRSASADVHATEVDPIAEAEVYIAYGRESQAEDILREALERQPERQAIRLKLLEMYAGRKDAPAFGRLAQEMYDMTGGHNEEWPKAAMLGLAVDPGNSLYAGGEVSAIADLDFAGANSSSAAGTNSPSAAGAKFLSSLGLSSLSAQGADSLRGEGANSLTSFDADSLSSLGADPLSGFSADRLSGFGANPAGGFGARKGEMEPFDTSAPIAEPLSGGPAADADADSSGRMPLHASWYHTDVLPSDFAEMQPTRDEVVSREPPALDFSLEMDAFGERTTEEATEQFALADDHGELERAAAGRFDFPSLDFGPGPRGAALTAGAPATPDSGWFSAAPARAERQRIEGAADEQVDSERSPVFAELGDFRIDLPALEDLDLEGVRHPAVFEAEGQALALAGLDVVPAEDNTVQWQEMATKLDLASAYEEIGDKDGARELLEEVVRAGDAGQKHTAEAMLSKIA